MIIFDKAYHQAVKNGRITLTFKLWDTLRVLRGKIYRSHNLGLIKILDVDFKKLSDITLEEIKKCGFRTIKDFNEEISNHHETDLDFEKDRIVRIEFEYIGEDIENYKKAMGNVRDSEIFNIKEQLLILDQKNKTPWIKKTLKILRDKGPMLSKDIESEVKIPVDRLKHHMRKLKALNLVSSNNRKGYSITPLGSKLLKSLNYKPVN